MNEKSDDIYSVQGVIELGLKRLRPSNEISSVISSRTDAGVHALSTTLHVDLQRYNNKAYNPYYITYYLNSCFFKYDIPIRINNCYLVPPDLDFHCRFSATSRTYVYRLAVLKQEKFDERPPDQFDPFFIPIEETDRCFFLHSPTFDVEAIEEVLPLFKGRHDFRTFMSVNSNNKEKDCRFTIRIIYDISIKRSESATTVYNRTKTNDFYDYYDIQVTGKSFLYRQVRRIVSTLIAVGQGKKSRKDVYEMITIPSVFSWPSSIQVVPGCSLYLCQVNYHKSDVDAILSYNEPFKQLAKSEKQVEAH